MADETNSQETGKFLTHDDLNGALKKQRKDFEKALAAMQDQNKALVETLQKTLGKPEEPLTRTEATDRRLQELKEQNDLLMKRLNERDEREKVMTKKDTVRQALTKAGIVSKAEIAMKYLDDQIFYDDEGQLSMKVDGIDHKLADAVAKFAQTDEGKFLADPHNIRGSGGRPTSNAPKGNQSVPVSEQMTEMGGIPVFKDAKSLQDYAASVMGGKQLKF
jgi:hypothetical protein